MESGMTHFSFEVVVSLTTVAAIFDTYAIPMTLPTITQHNTTLDSTNNTILVSQ